MFRIMAVASLLAFGAASAQAERLSADPFPTPIEAQQGVIGANFIEFAKVPFTDNGEAPRLMHMVAEPQTKRLFVSTMRGMLYSISYDGKQVQPYIDISAPEWGLTLIYGFQEQGLQSFAFHPQFNQPGTPGYGKFYTYLDTPDKAPKADFVTPGGQHSHDTLLLEWTAKTPGAASYDGGKPKEVFRAAQPFLNHNAGQIGFNPLAQPNSEDFGLLYIGLADGGAGGDPMKVGQNLNNAFGKILRIDPLGSNSANKKYGIPASNPFVGKADALGEIYAYGVRNPQRFNWDPKDGRMLLAEIGQNQVEEISPVTAGANLGWSVWEGSYKYVNGQVDLDEPRSEAGVTWPLVEFDHRDPLLQRMVAMTGLVVYRADENKQLQNLMIFGDIPTGEVFYVNADASLQGGQDAIRRILLVDGGKQKNLLQVINDKFTAEGKPAANRADLRFGFGPNQEVFLMNKRDGIIRLLGTKGIE